MNPHVTPNPSLERAVLHAAVAEGNIPSMLPVLYQLTGDEKWLSAPYVPARTRGFEELDDGGLEPAIQAEIRDALIDAVLAWSQGTPVVHPAPTGDQLVRLMSAAMGEPIPELYAPLVAEQLGFTPYSPSDRTDRIRDSRPDFAVAIIGAGISGLTTSIHLDKAGIPHTIFERNKSVGGTWWENRYPGARVDIPSDLYSFSFHPRNWSEHFARRDEIFEYVSEVAEDHGVTDRIRFGHRVDSATWDEEDQKWILSVTCPDGRVREFRANALVTAAGLHTTPNIPDYQGASEFAGDVVHSAEWPEDLDLHGKRVAVVGNGASAMQLVVAIADEVESMVVLQRKPQWIAPNENYFTQATPTRHWLFDNIPFYRGWYRFRLYWLYTERTYDALAVDPEREEKGKRVSSLNDAYRAHFTAYLESELDGDEELRSKTIPEYPPFGTRLLIDNGWIKTLRKPHVELLSDTVSELTRTGFVTSAGESRDIDLLILCTGFQQQRFLFPMEIRGRDGSSLRDSWGDDNGRAYLGITTPGFPNLFFLYGPNTNPPGGSWITVAEAQSRYIVESIGRLVDEDLDSIEVTLETFERYNDELDAANASKVYAMDGADSYYRNSSGRVVTNSPWRVPEYWARTATPEPADFHETARQRV